LHSDISSNSFLTLIRSLSRSACVVGIPYKVEVGSAGTNHSIDRGPR
jgi:hypothetical protein